MIIQNVPLFYEKSKCPFPHITIRTLNPSQFSTNLFTPSHLSSSADFDRTEKGQREREALGLDTNR